MENDFTPRIPYPAELLTKHEGEGSENWHKYKNGKKKCEKREELTQETQR